MKYGYHEVGDVLTVAGKPCQVIVDRTEDGVGCVLNINGHCPRACDELCRPCDREDHKCVKYKPLV